MRPTNANDMVYTKPCDAQLITAVMRLHNEHGVLCGNNLYAIQSKCTGVVLGMIMTVGTSNRPLPPGMWIQYEPYEASLKRWLPIWRDDLGLPDPDLIIVNQNLWELSRRVFLPLR